MAEEVAARHVAQAPGDEEEEEEEEAPDGASAQRTATRAASSRTALRGRGGRGGGRIARGRLRGQPPRGQLRRRTTASASAGGASVRASASASVGTSRGSSGLASAASASAASASGGAWRTDGRGGRRSFVSSSASGARVGACAAAEDPDLETEAAEKGCCRGGGRSAVGGAVGAHGNLRPPAEVSQTGSFAVVDARHWVPAQIVSLLRAPSSFSCETNLDFCTL